MIIGLIMMGAVIGFSHLFSQGLEQLQQNNIRWRILSQVDKWTLEITQEGVEPSQLLPGSYSKPIEIFPGMYYDFQWKVQSPKPHLIMIYFQIVDPQSPSQVIHEWKNALNR
ncbi:hypothetical protein WDW89_06165 [Deltaproteobacteria bacterium TL4]